MLTEKGGPFFGLSRRWKALRPSALLRPILAAVFGLCAAFYAQAGGGREIVTHEAEGVDIWETGFDVRELRPGTWNIIINAQDSAGNVGVSGPFNLRVDPMANLPGTRIVYPAPGQVIRGEINVVGVTNAFYGVRRILARINDGEFFPVEGEGFWHLNIPAGGLPDGGHSIFAKVEDMDGLEGPVSRIDFIVDSGPPAIVLTSHDIGDFVSGRVRVQGTVTDVNGIASLYLSRDGEAFSPLGHSGRRRDPTREFRFNIDTRRHEDGPLVYFIRAVNETGSSVTEPVLFFVNNVPPVLEILSPGPEEDAFGMVQVSGRVVSQTGIEELFYEWEGQRVDIPRVRPGDPFWTIVVPVEGRSGNLRITAVDRTGNVARRTVQLRDRRPARAPVIAIDYPGLSGRNLVLAYDQPIYGQIAQGFFPFAVRLESGWQGRDGELVMAQPGFRIDPHLIPQGRNNLVLRAIDENGLEGPTLNMRVDREAPPEGFAMPAASPITIEGRPGYWTTGPGTQPWAGASITIGGHVRGWAPGVAVEYRLGPEDRWRPVAVNAEETEIEEDGEIVGTRPAGSFEATVNLLGYVPREQAAVGGLAGNHVPLELRTRRPGREDFPVFLPVNRTAAGPAISFSSPDRQWGTIHGRVTTAGFVDSFAPLAELSYSTDGGYVFVPVPFTARAGRASFNLVVNFSLLDEYGHALIIRAVDRAGNEALAGPPVAFDRTPDIPVLILNSPLENELVVRDLEISGLAFDDDELAAVYWRVLRPLTPWETAEEILGRVLEAELEAGSELDAAAGYGYAENGIPGFARVATSQSFVIPMALDGLENGSNILEVFPVDIFGTPGEVTRRVLRVSLDSPETAVLEPPMEVWNTGNITVRGTSFDRNGVSAVFVSMDNGVSWQRAYVQSSQEYPSGWHITLNTRAFADGTYAMLVRAVDGFGVASYSSGIVNIDNTPPDLQIVSPGEGTPVSTELFVSGQVRDNMALKDVRIRVVNIEDPEIQETRELGPELVVMQRFDVSELPEGDYIVKINAFDYSGNETVIVRNVSIVRGAGVSEIAIINPLPGIEHSGAMVVSGRVSGAVIPQTVVITLNGRAEAVARVDRFGVFLHEIPAENLRGPFYAVRARFETAEGELIESVEHGVSVNAFGPVLTIESHSDGDVITGRPWLSGRAFMLHPEFDEDDPPSRQERAALRPSSVQLSFDNGRTFVQAGGRDDWRFRLEADELPAGPMPVVARAEFGDGSSAVRRILLTVDTAAPTVTTLGPGENTLFRHEIQVFGHAADNHQLESVQISLRQGNKNLYAVPGFIEGLYIDFAVLGGLRWATGIGLTFFDDNVKLQANVSQAEPGTRFEGMAFGGKLLANIWSVNLRRWFGPEFEFWTTSIALGANFSYFLMGEGETSQWMGQFLGQWEIIKADLSFFMPNWRHFSTVSLFMEPGVWFAPSDVGTDNPDAWRTMFTIGFGIRFSLF